MLNIQDPALPIGSLVLVTGSNGFIAGHVIDHFLLAGYRVRGTVRDAQKHSWLTTLFDNKYGKGKFELVEVKELDAPGALDTVLQGK